MDTFPEIFDIINEQQLQDHVCRFAWYRLRHDFNIPVGSAHENSYLALVKDEVLGFGSVSFMELTGYRSTIDYLLYDFILYPSSISVEFVKLNQSVLFESITTQIIRNDTINKIIK